MSLNGSRKSTVVWKTDGIAETQSEIVRISRTSLAFAIYGPEQLLPASQVLDGVEIYLDDTIAYTGRATVTQLIQAGTRTICEIGLAAPGIIPTSDFEKGLGSGALAIYDTFFRRWQQEYRLSSEFKVVVADVHSMLTEMQAWLQSQEAQLEAKFGDNAIIERASLVESLAPRIIGTFNRQHERFEELSSQLDPELIGAHQDFVRRLWHPLFLCTPFAHRTYTKPLGYAGDYEMMNMIHRNAPEGATLYSQIIHKLLVSQWPALSVRNRISHLQARIIDEVARVVRSGRQAQILNLGCGSAREVQGFIKESPLSDRASVTLLDFNEETLDHASRQLAGLKLAHARQIQVNTHKISVQQLLRRGLKAEHADDPRYDMIYCAGLFDYLNLPTCKAVVDYFYRSLVPGGLVVVANMDDSKPFRRFIEFVLDWHLIYRDGEEVGSFCPDHAREQAQVISEPSGVNIFLQVRKPL